jgi:hypothetical protein
VERSGYSTQRIDTLFADPAFQQLIAKYREKVDAAYERQQDAYAQLVTSNMVKSETMLAEKLEEAEEAGTFLPTRDLIAISRDGADRFGYGKRQTNLNVNADFASILEKAIARSGKTIEGVSLPSAIEAGSSPMPQSPPDASSPVAHPGESQQPMTELIRRRLERSRSW